MPRYPLWLTLAAAGLPQAAATQSPEAFAAAARRGSERFRVLAEAIADGYRALGPETPAMGQHWVQTRLLLEGVVVPEQPPILTYATVGGRPVLVGVAYAIPLAPGQADPDPPVPGSVWHAHSASLEMETHLVRHEAHGSHGGLGERVAVLHAWVWTENPDGLFEPDNWTLPYLRLGILPPVRLDGSVARALALAAGDSSFFLTQLKLRLGGSAGDSAAIGAEVHAASRELAAWWAGRRPGDGLAAEEERLLSERWRGLLRSLAARLSPRARERLWEAFER
ncbi:MAG TPA: hypothetical protein VGP61_09015 [Gemmatimonadales bacterium]|nr:hypothetical protein [Gemmatimonadales bacterium]